MPSDPCLFSILQNSNSSSYFCRTWVFSCNIVLFFSENVFWEEKLSVGFFFFPFKLNIIFCSIPGSVLKALHSRFYLTLTNPLWGTGKLKFGDSDLPKVTQLENSEAGIRTQVVWLQRLYPPPLGWSLFVCSVWHWPALKALLLEHLSLRLIEPLSLWPFWMLSSPVLSK